MSWVEVTDMSATEEVFAALSSPEQAVAPSNVLIRMNVMTRRCDM